MTLRPAPNGITHAAPTTSSTTNPREQSRRAHTLREAAEQLLDACDMPDELPGAENLDPEKMRMLASRLLGRADEIVTGYATSPRLDP
ncbi:hypothetical protein ASD43_07635 [Microbacterium sp. Root553]|nr:hypothetical protein ASD43_07635 [Microbacterium sp. Root553]